MNAFTTTAEFQASQADIEGPFETLIREHREAVAIAGGLTLWHYVPNLLWQHIEGRMDELEQAALRISCRDLARNILRDELPEWLLLGAAQTGSPAPAGSLFCIIVFDPARESDAQAWMDEIFMRAIAPGLIEALLDCVTEIMATRAAPATERATLAA